MLINSIILPSILIIIGIVLLVWSADLFVKGAADIADKLGIPSLLIGIVIIGFGTSLPEIIVSATSAVQGNPNIALGNAYGSNIFNIGLILGISAIISPILIQPIILKREFPILFFITLLSINLLWDLNITRIDSIIMLITFFAIMGWMIWSDLRNKVNTSFTKEQTKIKNNNNLILLKYITYVLIGLVILIFSSNLLVTNAVKIAQYFGVSDLIIGLSIVAIGTSLPELASSIAAARRGENGLTLGNIIGSNIFNTLAVVGIAGVIHQPFQVEPKVLSRDIPIILGLTIFLYVSSNQFIRQKGHGVISRLTGAFLLSAVIGYILLLFYSATH